MCLKLCEKLPEEFFFFKSSSAVRCQKKTIRGSGFTKGQMFTVNVNESLYRSGSLEINRIRAVFKGQEIAE